jgi:ribonuclease HI
MGIRRVVLKTDS